MFTLSLTLFGAIIPGEPVNSSQSQGTQGTLTFLSHLAGCTKGRAITVSWGVIQGSIGGHQGCWLSHKDQWGTGTVRV